MNSRPDSRHSCEYPESAGSYDDGYDSQSIDILKHWIARELEVYDTNEADCC